MPILASDLVRKCPRLEQSEPESGSFRWSPFIKDNTEGSPRGPVTTESNKDEMAQNEESHNTPAPLFIRMKV